ncbi:hypothetical protein [Lacticaseibacillus sp. 866-1]|uniref:hypothetical protein n=1 Tax=Lacticaseibacillus sp. 866-1 TaxID=2799576 RepID=UPI0019406AC3|nr:hypothetical protein [Lacticaseibacillus sp. 866-1]
MSIRWQKWLFMLIGSLLFVLSWVASAPTRVEAADYDDFTVASYGIPTDVIQVMLNNSIDQNGNLASKDFNTGTLTVGDVENFKTISLADITYDADGNMVSGDPDDQPTDDTVVATAIKNAVDSGSKDNIDLARDGYAQNTNDVVTVGSSNEPATLLTRTITIDTHVEKPWVNLLFQIVASADNATLADLDGVTSLITDSSTAQSVMALFQTNRMTHLDHLIASHDNLGDLTQILYNLAKSYQTLFGVTDSQRITKLDLSNNGIPTIPWTIDFPIQAYLTDLDLSGNTINVVTDSLQAVINTVVLTNHGTGDMSGMPRDVQNGMDWLKTLLNNTNGTIVLGEALNSIIMQEVPSQISLAAIIANYENMNSQTAKAILATIVDNSSVITGHNRDIAFNYLNEAIYGPDFLQVSGSLKFSVPLSALSDPQPTVDALVIAAVLWPGGTISAQMDDWTGPTAFNASLTFSGTNAFRSASDGDFTLIPSAQAQTFYRNSTGAVDTQTVTYGGTSDSTNNALSNSVELLIDKASAGLIQPGSAYSTVITWTIGNSLSAQSH